MFNFKKKNLGFSLVEVLVVSAVTLIIFSGLFAAFKYTLELTSESRAKMTALSLVNDRIEFIRSLSYDAVGTVSGIPSGSIPQNRTVSLNGIDFSERVLVEYVDDPADGTGGSDSNGVLADYKRVKIEYSWVIGESATSSFYIVSSIVPRSIETTSGGGSLRVNVIDKDSLPLPGADVRLVNDTTTSTIDVTRTTDTSGIALFTGAPAASNYEIFVSASGYSSDQTYQATTSLPIPTTQPVSVLEADVSTMYFQIDQLGDLNIKIMNGQTENSITETFVDMSGVATSSNATTSSGSLELTEVGGVYDSSGFVMLNSFIPSPIENWKGVEIDSSLPAGTEVRVSFYTSTNTADIISDADLPGNSAGFTGDFIDLQALDVDTYPTLAVGISLSTPDTNLTPQVSELEMTYIESESVSAGSVIGIKGGKTIGTLGDGTPVYKFDVSTTTDGNGEVFFEDIEWDEYTVEVPAGKVIAEACYSHPFTLMPDTSLDIDLLLVASTTNSLRVAVQAPDGSPIVGADVDFSRTGYSEVTKTGWCGQSFFSGLVSETDYVLDVSATGYTGKVLDPFTVDGENVEVITLTP